jgi:hypothetical protein
MRRALAILLEILFGWILLVPAFVIPSNSGVPACCRKDGKHHCMMPAAEPDVSKSAIASITAKCPYFPQATVATQAHPAPPSIKQAIFAGLIQHPAGSPQTEAGYRVSCDRSRQKRGPPSIHIG